MASKEVIEPLLPTSSNTIGTRILDIPSSKRRLRRTKSAPHADSPQSETTGTGTGTGAGADTCPVPRSGLIFGNLGPSLRRVALVLILYMGIGTLCFYLVRYQIKGEKTNGIVDAIYFTIVTMTTVGYGDLVPSSPSTKLLACAFVFSGMALVGLILSSAADYLVEKQEILLFKTLNAHQNGHCDMTKEIDTDKARNKCIVVFLLLILFIISGTVFLVNIEKLGFIDAFYCVCSTITTLGYGDKSFSTKSGRIFAIFWILISTITLAQFFLYIAELNTERRQKSLVKWVLSKKVTNLDLEAADLDNDRVVGAAEFVIHKLKEMGKITEDDIAPVLKEFEKLDVDQSGTLSISDLTLAQSS
ncbi:two-pore potassium channel 1-like [Cucurbita moschata]|uniref:Two-pore potassium channel 1-like n=1 Tax=Cucurbita moschata TaxID=3662 RepID=A0A6J1FPA6_CUCMO|nr:two-pore potassium channel 1-like [Cucurbita moschata]